MISKFSLFVYGLIFLSQMEILSVAAAEGLCDEAQTTAQRNCAMAIRMASANSDQNQSQGITGSAQQYASSLSLSIDAMKTATQYCEDQQKKCETACEPNASPGRLGYPEASQLTCIGGNCKNGRPTGPIVPCKENSPNCSPLVVQIGEQKLAMNPPDRGVWFDVLGANAPVSYVPVRISWPTAASLSDNYFLTLPAQSALVLGIDELFGNNTRGPAGSRPFAENGFEALRKYDGRLANGDYDLKRRDGTIDSSDEIFNDLRLWRDANANGVAEFDELFTLTQLEVRAIDLNYDPEFEENDNYGNMIKTKSVVQMQNGNLKLIFDLWFVSAR